MDEHITAALYRYGKPFSNHPSLFEWDKVENWGAITVTFQAMQLQFVLRVEDVGEQDKQSKVRNRCMQL